MTEPAEITEAPAGPPEAGSCQFCEHERWPEWMDVDVAARYVGLHPEWLRQLSRQGKISYARVGEGSRSPFRYRREWLDEFLERRKVRHVERTCRGSRAAS